MIIPSNDIIECDAWKKIADHHYGGGKLPPKGLVHCRVKYLYEFLKRCRQKKGAGPYVLMTSDEDYGLVYQERHPVLGDILKYVAMMHFKTQIENDSGDSYGDVTIPARCDVRHCDMKQRFSFKSYAHTELTFDTLPNNVKHWFAVNGAVEEDFVTTIPIGVQRGQAELLGKVEQNRRGLSPSYTYSVDIEGSVRIRTLYVNFSLHTKARCDAFNYFFLKDYEWATVIQDQGRTEEEFLEDIGSHDFVLCPQGNGVDTYRLWQAIYLGAIPIVNSTMQESFFEGLPILWCDNLNGIQPGPLESVKEIAAKASASFEKARLSYWKTRIANKVREVLEGARGED